MTRRVFLLMGLAILAVVWSHAAGWGQIAMFLWADRYRPVTGPNFDQLGSLPSYVLSAIRQLTIWAVPAFLFVSGFFVAYADRGSQSGMSWKNVVRARIINLLLPYLIWSGVCFIGDALGGVTYAPLEYLKRLAVGRADGGGYFYVPLLCQFYLLSPLIAPLARTRWRLLLFVSALLQLVAFGLRYLDLFGARGPGLRLMVQVTPSWSFFMWAFFFPFGIVCGLHIRQLKGWLARRKWSILVVTIILGLLAVVEPEVIYRTTASEWRFMRRTIATSLYSVAFVLCFLAFDKVSVPFSGIVYWIGRRSYAIYLLHNKVMEFVARVIRQIAPWMLAQQVLLLKPVVFVFGLGVPLLFMALISRSLARRSYRYLFG
jgi:membrane-bound acyltransferase YfiQ involved in biofilm formation